MRVYRIEHPTSGNGPYRHDTWGYELSSTHTDALHPSKGMEFPTQHYDDQWYCCFDNMDC
jgi:hypothetical protein